MEQPSQETMDNKKLLKLGLNFSSQGFKTYSPEGTMAIIETKCEHVEREGSVAQFIIKGKIVSH